MYVLKRFNFLFIQTINRTSASDEELEEAEVQYLTIFSPKVPAPTVFQIQQMIVEDEWVESTPPQTASGLERTPSSIAIGSEKTPPPIPTELKWMILPVELS